MPCADNILSITKMQINKSYLSSWKISSALWEAEKWEIKPHFLACILNIALFRHHFWHWKLYNINLNLKTHKQKIQIYVTLQQITFWPTPYMTGVLGCHNAKLCHITPQTITTKLLYVTFWLISIQHVLL